MPTAELPLFPLQTVLFPGCELDLRIFEARYLDMVRACLRNQTPFVVVAIRSGQEVGAAEPFQVGTTASIVDWSNDASRILGLRVIGEERFMIDSYRRAADGLYLGTGRSMPAPVGSAARPDFGWASRMLAAILENPAPAERDALARSVDDQALDDPDWVCWNLAARMPLTLSEKQTLLELEDVESRLRQLRIRAGELAEELQGDD